MLQPCLYQFRFKPFGLCLVDSRFKLLAAALFILLRLSLKLRAAFG